jgi:hypothetical protein
LAESLFAQFCLDATKSVPAPHGAAAVLNGHDGLTIFFLQNGSQTVTQVAWQTPIKSGFVLVHHNGPFLTAAVGAGRGNAAELIVKSGFCDSHNDS